MLLLIGTARLRQGGWLTFSLLLYWSLKVLKRLELLGVPLCQIVFVSQRLLIWKIKIFDWNWIQLDYVLCRSVSSRIHDLVHLQNFFAESRSWLARRDGADAGAWIHIYRSTLLNPGDRRSVALWRDTEFIEFALHTPTHLLLGLHVHKRILKALSYLRILLS